MQAYKLKGKIDEAGHLIIAAPIGLGPGEVEVIVLQASSNSELTSELDQQLDASSQKHASPIKAFQGLFENAPPVSSDFDPDQAKWEYLKEKHNL